MLKKKIVHYSSYPNILIVEKLQQNIDRWKQKISLLHFPKNCFVDFFFVLRYIIHALPFTIDSYVLGLNPWLFPF